MNLTPLEQKVLKTLQYHQSVNKSCSRLGISREQYLEIRNKLQNLTKPKVKLTSEHADLESGQTQLTGVFADRPLSAEDIIEKFQIDTTKWKLIQYWNKEKQSGGYFVSANIARIKDSEVVSSDLEEVIKRVFNKTNLKPVVSYPNITNRKALFVYTSDKHIGAYVSGDAIYENSYNALTFETRMRLLLAEILYLNNTFGSFDDVFILDLGDALDGQNGQTTRGGHRLPQNMNNKEAFETYLRVHKNFYDSLVSNSVAHSYHAYTVTEDNHSGDYGYYAARSLETYLNLVYPQIETRVFKKFIEHFTYGHHTFMVTHGKDSEDMKHGFPLVLNDKAENYINKYIRYHNISTPNIHFIKGDLHQESSQVTDSFRYRNVLSMFGSSKWMMNNFSSTGKGGCSIEIVEKDTSRIFQHKIKFK